MLDWRISGVTSQDTSEVKYGPMVEKDSDFSRENTVRHTLWMKSQKTVKSITEDGNEQSSESDG